MVETVISHYALQEKIGSGGMGVVFKAHDTKLDRTVALKFLPQTMTNDKKARKRLIREAQTISKLQHHNICTVHTIDETDDGQVFICMDYYDGQTLEDRIKDGPLPEGEIKNITKQIVSGLAKAHQQNIVHRDIKPSNIMITSDGVIKILDFGLAKLQHATVVTREGARLGTLAYMSPEQARGDELDQKSDIWSLGVLVYQMLSGELPFNGQYDQAMLYSILNEEPASISGINEDTSAELDRIVSRALEKDPTRRYRTVEDFLDDIESSTGEIKEVLSLPKRKRQIKFFPFWLIGLTLLIIPAGWLLWEIFKPDRESITGANFSRKLAVMVCENRHDQADQNQFGEIVTDLLITNLMESPNISVTSVQRLYDLLRQSGVENPKHTDRPIQLDLARQAGAEHIISPTYAKIGNLGFLQASFIEVSSGRLLETIEHRGPENNLFALVDSFTIKVKNELGNLYGHSAGYIARSAQISTQSTDAMRYYLDGQKYFSDYHMLEAESAFRMAIAVDSAFASAYSRLAWVYMYLQRPTEKMQCLQNAKKYLNKLPRREKFYVHFEIEHLRGNQDAAKDIVLQWITTFPDDKEAYYQLAFYYEHTYKMYDEAILNFRAVLRLDPGHRLAHNYLGYSLAHKGLFDEALAEIDIYIQSAPDEVNPYDSQGEIYMNAIKNYKTAEKVFKKAYRIDPTYSSHKLAEAYRLQGKYRQAGQILKEYLAVAGTVPQAYKYFVLARLHFDRQDFKTCRVMLDLAKASHDNLHYYLWFSGLTWLKQDSIHRAINDLNTLGQIKNDRAEYNHLAGQVKIAGGEIKSGIVLLQKAVDLSQPFSISHQRHIEFFMQDLAIAYLSDGAIKKAKETFQKILKINPNWAWTHYELGKLYELTGEQARSKQAYESFLEVWAEADPDLPRIATARNKLR